MPKLSLYRENFTNDYKWFDRRISEQFTVGCATVLIHKYVGPVNQGTSNDATQPDYLNQSVNNIQDLLYLENRDRKYDTTVYRLRMHHTMQNIDFDLTQFGLFLNNDTLFCTVHKTDCVNTLGRLLMSGDVIEMPYLREFFPLNYDEVQTSLKRYYVVQDTANAAEGFSPTWYPHLWRVKCEPLVDSQEFAQILNQPEDQTNYFGPWGNTIAYFEGDRVTFGDKNYIAKQDVPTGVAPTGKDDDPYWGLDPNQTFRDMMSTYQKNIDINNAILAQAEAEVPLSGYDTVPFYIVPTTVDGEPLGSTYTADQTLVNSSQTDIPSSSESITPRNNAWTMGYLTGDGLPPNGAPVTPGVVFPHDPREGDFCLRLDYMPNRLFRFDGAHWVKFEDRVRTNITPSNTNDTEHYGFYNNPGDISTTDRGEIPRKQSLSKALRPKDDN